MKTEISKSALVQAEGIAQWSFLLNGAAAASLLTFLGNAAEKQKVFADWSLLLNALLAFATGLLLAIGSRAAMLLSLNLFAQMKEPSSDPTIDNIKIYLIVGDRAFILA